LIAGKTLLDHAIDQFTTLPEFKDS